MVVIDKRTYVGEMEWALNEAYAVGSNDRNPHRQAQLMAALQYGLAVGIARRSKEPMPPRPDMKKAI